MSHIQESPFLQLSLSPAALWLSSLDVGQLNIFFFKKEQEAGNIKSGEQV